MNKKDLFDKEESRLFSRAFFITMDFLLQTLKEKGKFDSISFNPVAGKIDPFDIRNFKADLKILKEEKMKNLCGLGMEVYKNKLKVPNQKPFDTILEIMESVSKSVFDMIDYSYKDVPHSHNFGKFIIFSFFRMHVDPEKDDLPEAHRKILKYIVEVSQSKHSEGIMSEEQISNSFKKSEFEEILQNPKYCSSTLMFTLMDRHNSLLGVMDYYIDHRGDIKLKDDMTEFYGSLSYAVGNSMNYNTIRLADLLPLEESSIKLLEICS